MDWIGQGALDPPPASSSSAASAASASHGPAPGSLPYYGDLDAARRARDSHAVRLLTQLRDRSSLSRSSRGGLVCLPAASQSSRPVPASSSSPPMISTARQLHGLDLAAGANSSSKGAPQPAAEGSRPLPPAPIIQRQAAPASAQPPALFVGSADGSSPTTRAKLAVGRISVTGAGLMVSPPGGFGPTGAGDSDPIPGGRAAGAAVAHQRQRHSFAFETERPAPAASVSSCCCPQHQHHFVPAAKGGITKLARAGQQVASAGPTAAGEAPDAAAGEAVSGLGLGREEEVTIEDPVLLVRVSLSQSYLVECACLHRFGLETLYGCIKAALGDDLIPACPLANHPESAQRCNYLLSQKEVEHVLNRYLPVSRLPAADRRLWRFRRGRLVDGRLGWVSERVSEAFLRKGKITAGCMECPNGRCGYWVEPTRPREKQRADCPKCLMAFCTLCKRPYHYRCSCDEVMTITKQWLEWQQHGREPYLQQMAAEDSSYQAALDTFNSRRETHVREVRTAEESWALLVADENYKASRCRRCPHCQRVIERIDGCDTMVCGQNAHGGNIQNGCGRAFDWNEALPYAADIGQKRSIKPFEEVPPPEISRVTHQIMDGTPIKCDMCQAQIQGPLAMCINCPSFNCCIRCQNKHTRGHFLRLYMDSSYREHMQAHEEGQAGEA